MHHFHKFDIKIELCLGDFEEVEVILYHLLPWTVGTPHNKTLSTTSWLAFVGEWSDELFAGSQKLPVLCVVEHKI